MAETLGANHALNRDDVGVVREVLPREGGVDVAI